MKMYLIVSFSGVLHAFPNDLVNEIVRADKFENFGFNGQEVELYIGTIRGQEVEAYGDIETMTSETRVVITTETDEPNFVCDKVVAVLMGEEKDHMVKDISFPLGVDVVAEDGKVYPLYKNTVNEVFNCFYEESFSSEVD